MSTARLSKIRILAALIISCILLSIPKAIAQTAGLTIHIDDGSLEEVVDKIENQSSYLFLIDKGIDIRSISVTLHADNIPIDEVLETLSENTGLKYVLEGMNIIVTGHRHHPRNGTSALVQISGIVSDTYGNPVAGAAVLERGTGNGTSTDAQGAFVMTVHEGCTLVVDCLGYETETITAGRKSVLYITLEEAAVELEGTVVTALGIRRKEKALSYTVQQIRPDGVTTVKDANFMNSLAGKVAGLAVNPSSSGTGGATQVILRGSKAISQSSNAMYVIDGIPMYNFGRGGSTGYYSRGETEFIADINPEDIESISILSGAAASALYGSHAANGVVLISTRKGHKGALKVSLNSATEFINPARLPSLQNRYGSGLDGITDIYSAFSWGPLLDRQYRTGSASDDFFRTGHVYSNSLTVSGGSDRNRTFFSAAAVNSDGFIPNNRYDRYNFTFRNTSLFLKDRLQIDASASYIYQLDRNMTNQGFYSNPLVPLYLFPKGQDFGIYKVFERFDDPTNIMTQFWPDYLEGDDLHMQNPYWIVYRNLRNTDRKRYMLTLNADYTVFDWLDISGRVRIDNSYSIYTQKLYATTDTTIAEGGGNGHYTESRGYTTQTYADIIVNVSKSFGKWSLDINAGASVSNVKSDEMTYGGPIRENGLPNVFNVFDLDDDRKQASKEGWREQTQSVFANVELGWKSMLYLTVTGRNDWASQLAGSPRSSFYYPSVGLSWVPTSLWSWHGAVSFLKLRGSFASVGMPFPRFLTTPTYAYDQDNRNWSVKTHYPIGDLYPERTRAIDAGVDMTLWNSLTIMLSGYVTDTYNQTFDSQLSVSSGYSTLYVQTGSVRNYGLEATIDYSARWEDLVWSSKLVYSWNRNRITGLADNYTHPETGEIINLDRLVVNESGRIKHILKKGGSLGDLYTNSSLKFNGNGYVELDQTGNIQIDDSNDDIYLGSVFPDHRIAWGNDLVFKNIRASVIFSGRIGGICYSATQAYMDLYGVSEASAAARDAGGILVNGREVIDAQKWYQTVASQGGLPQYYTYSATNFRLQELSVGYTLPRRWFRDRLGLTLSVFGKNLWMIYCKAPFDPETIASTELNYQGIDRFMMPSTRNIGLNLRFEF